MVGTTPLIIQLPDTAPIMNKISMAGPMALILSSMALFIRSHGTLNRIIPMATATPAAKSSAVWLAPSRASAPNTRITTTCKAINTANGIKAIVQWIGCGWGCPFFSMRDFYWLQRYQYFAT